jgi:hypothetical protein
MGDLFREFGLALDPRHVITSEKTETNATTYRLKATVELVHVHMKRAALPGRQS